jgi:hypothetical protein
MKKHGCPPRIVRVVATNRLIERSAYESKLTRQARISADANALLRATGFSNGYINVFTDVGWVIENLFVDVNDQSPGVMYFSLGLAQPMDVKQLSAYVVYSPKPQTSFTDGQRSTFPVGTDVWNVGGE